VENYLSPCLGVASTRSRGMPPLTDLLTGDQTTLRRIRARATQSEAGPCPDLVWEDADFDEMATNPGVRFDAPDKRVVVHAVGDTVRYFCSPCCAGTRRRRPTLASAGGSARRRRPTCDSSPKKPGGEGGTRNAAETGCRGRPLQAGKLKPAPQDGR
jgi:hypothetical protein